MRCTRSTLMYRGGQINLATHVVWVSTPHGAVRINDALKLSRFDGEVTILIAPLTDESALAQPSAVNFTNPPTGWLSRRTSYQRATGSGHMDLPLTPTERAERINQVQKSANRLASSARDPKRRAELAAGFAYKLTDLFTTHGTDRINDALSDLASTCDSPQAVMRALRELPSLADLAGAPASVVGPAHPPRATAALVALQPVPGNHPAPNITVEFSDPRSIHPHALARWLERVEGRIDPELIDATRSLLTSRSSRAAAQAASEKLDIMLAERGLNATFLKDVRLKIVEALSDGPRRTEPRPVFSQRRVHDYGGENDRALLSVSHIGTTLEFTVRARSTNRSPAGKITVALEVISMWPVATALEHPDPWVDKSIAPEYQEQWSLALQERLISAISRR